MKQSFPARSVVVGWISSLVLLLLLSFAVFMGFRHGVSKNPAAWIVPALGAAAVAVAVFFAAILPTMHYTVSDLQLVFCCGPFHWVIPIATVRSIAERDLQWLPWSEGWKLPGYALFRISYGDMGVVRMCASSLTRRILIIETDTEVWGITPADVDGFVAAIGRGRKD